MSWNFSAWSIRNPVPPILLFVVLCAFGIVSFMGLPITRFPNIDIPLISVTVTDAGTAPAELETQVTKKVEDAVASIAGSMVAIGIAGLALIAVPVAALVVFGPALWDMIR